LSIIFSNRAQVSRVQRRHRFTILYLGSSVAPFIIAGVMKLAPKGTEVYYSFLILAVLILIKSFPLLFAPSPEINKAEEKEANGSDSGKCMKKDQVPYVVMVGTISTLLFIYVGAEVTYGGWIYTYAVKVYDISPPESAIISSAFWGAITIGRLIAGTFHLLDSFGKLWIA
jgi:fucose permease